MMQTPDWMPTAAWAGFVEMRRKIKKPMTDRAADLIIIKLDGFRAAGHDVEAILNRSVENSWQGVFEPDPVRGSAGAAGSKVPHLGKAGQATANSAQDWLESAPVDNVLEEKRRFAALITGLSDYYKSEISRAVLGLYWEGLRQYDFAAIEKACWAHTQNPDTGMWMPKVADIVKMLAGRTDDQAKIAWAKVDRGVRSVGIYQDVAFDDPIIHRVIADMGGWVALCGKNEDEWPFIAKEFETRYRAFRSRGEIPAYAPSLIGLASSQNSSQGMQHNAGVMLIGEREKAIAVIKNGKTGSLLQLGMVDAAELTSGPGNPPLLS
jgi:hypothetical protein